MQRLRLSSYHQNLLTDDTIDAIRRLRTALDSGLWGLDLFGPLKQPSQDHDLIAAGREVHLRLNSSWRSCDAQTALGVLWREAQKQGFTTKLRYPIANDPSAYTFYYLGPWQAVLDHLLAAGEGPFAWETVCVAARCDVGAWKRDRELERFAQAQLHRLGYHCGAVNGVLGLQVQAALDQAGVAGMPLVKAALELSARDT